MISEFRNKYRFLSNFYPCVVKIDGIEYPTIEHAFQAMKVHDDDIREVVARQKTPGDAKRMGNTLPLRHDWESTKLGIMERLLRIKFSKEPLKTWLLGTNSEELIEGNYYNDYFWGVCNGKGENHLGKLLMKIREELAGKPMKGEA